MRWLALLPLCVAVWACPAPPDLGEDGGSRGPIVVGPEGGRFVRECGALEIPRGALAATTQIVLAPVSGGIPEINGRTVLGEACRFSPASLQFLKPVKVSLTYLDADIPAAGIDPQMFSLHRQVGSDPPAALDQATVDTTIKVVTAQTDRLGTFWLTSPNDPLLEDLVVSPPELLLRVGETAQLTITLLGLDGQPTTDLPYEVSLVPARMGTLSATGLFTALAPGNAILTVRASALVREVPVRIQGDTRGPLTFRHDTPFPTGNDLFGGVSTASGSLLVAGGNATILERDAAGTWTRRFSATGGTLRAIGTATDGTLVAVGTAGTLGLLVTQGPADEKPTLRTFDSVLPQALWFDGTFGMAVGRGNDVLVLHEGTWSAEDSPSFETLLSVTGDGAGGFVTLGSQGSLYVYDPATRTWDSLFQAQLSTLLTAGFIAQPDGSEAWAVGGNRLWHFTGAGWSSENLPAAPVLSTQDAVALIAGELVVAGSHEGRGQLLRRSAAAPSGAAWASQGLRGPQIIRALVSDGASGGFALGDLGALWRRTPAEFLEESRGFYGDVADVSASQDGTVVAAVNDCLDAACTRRVGQVMRRLSPGVWEPLLPQAVSEEEGRVHAVLARSATDIWVGTDVGVIRWNGSAWSSATLTPPHEAMLDLAQCGTEIVAVGARGTVLLGSDQLVFASAGTTRDLHAVSCTGRNNLWFAGDSILLENGESRESPKLPHAAWRAVYTPAPGEALALGAAGYGVTWDTQQLRVIDRLGGIAPDLVSGMWGSSLDNLYAVGFTSVPFRFGFALRFDGAFWRSIDSGASRTSTSVDGWDPEHVWIGTQGGGVLQGVMP